MNEKALFAARVSPLQSSAHRSLGGGSCTHSWPVKAIDLLGAPQLILPQGFQGLSVPHLRESQAAEHRHIQKTSAKEIPQPAFECEEPRPRGPLCDGHTLDSAELHAQCLGLTVRPEFR